MDQIKPMTDPEPLLAANRLHTFLKECGLSTEQQRAAMRMAIEYGTAEFIAASRAVQQLKDRRDV